LGELHTLSCRENMLAMYFYYIVQVKY
jgi:hypothetical protein